MDGEHRTRKSGGPEPGLTAGVRQKLSRIGNSLLSNGRAIPMNYEYTLLASLLSFHQIAFQLTSAPVIAACWRLTCVIADCYAAQWTNYDTELITAANYYQLIINLIISATH